MLKINFHRGKIQFPRWQKSISRFGCPPNKLYRECQPIKWECYCVKNQFPPWPNSISKVVKINFLPHETPGHFRAGYACTGGNWFLLRWKLISTNVEIDFCHGGKLIFTTVGNLISSNKFMTSSEFTQVPPFFSLKIYATARGTQVADAYMKNTKSIDKELAWEKKNEHIATYRVNTLREFLKFIHVGAQTMSSRK